MLLLSCLVAPWCSLDAAVIYVDGNRPTNPPEDGRSWATAFTTVGVALAAAQDGDEIWVAEGAYTESLTLKSGVALYGGFDGVETQRAERNWNLHPSVLDGGGVASVVRVLEGAQRPSRCRAP